MGEENASSSALSQQGNSEGALEEPLGKRQFCLSQRYYLRLSGCCSEPPWSPCHPPGRCWHDSQFCAAVRDSSPFLPLHLLTPTVFLQADRFLELSNTTFNSPYPSLAPSSSGRGTTPVTTEVESSRFCLRRSSTVPSQGGKNRHI